jgi:hypothetical protein
VTLSTQCISSATWINSSASSCAWVSLLFINVNMSFFRDREINHKMSEPNTHSKQHMHNTSNVRLSSCSWLITKTARATLKRNSIPSTKKISHSRSATFNGKLYTNTVENHSEAYNKGVTPSDFCVIQKQTINK